MKTFVDSAKAALGFSNEASTIVPVNDNNTKLLRDLIQTPNLPIENIKKLLSQGANPYSEDEQGKSAFYYANNKNDLAVMHLMHQARPLNSDDFQFLKARTEAEILAKENDVAALNEIAAYTKKSNMPDIQADIEKAAVKLGFEALNKVLEEVNTNISTTEAYAVEKKQHQEFDHFIEQNPILGKDMSDKGLAKKVLNYVCAQALFGRDDEDRRLGIKMLDKVTQLLIDQHPELKQKIVNYLVVQSNGAIKQYDTLKRLDSIIKVIEPDTQKRPNYKFGALSDEQFDQLDVLASYANQNRKDLEKFISQNSDASFQTLQELYHAIHMTNGEIPEKLQEQNIAVIREATRRFLEKSTDLNETREILKLASDNKVKIIDSSDISPNISQERFQEIAYTRGVADNILGGGFKNAHTKEQLQAFSKFLEQKPILGNLQDTTSLGKKTLDLAVDYIRVAPELIDKVAACVDNSQLDNFYNLLIDRSNASKDLEQQKSINKYLLEKEALESKVSKVMDDAIKANNIDLLNAVITQNPAILASKIVSYDDVQKLYNNPNYKEAAAAIINSSQTTAKYLDQELSKPNPDPNLISFIYQHKGKQEIVWNEQKIDDLSTKQSFNSVVTQILKDANETEKNDFASLLLKQDAMIDKLDDNTLSALAPYYNPQQGHSSKIISRLIIDAYATIKPAYLNEPTQYPKATCVELARHFDHTLSQNSAFQKTVTDYVNAQASYETKPILTWFKAMFSGKSKDEYMKAKLTERVKKIASAISDAIEHDKRTRASIVNPQEGRASTQTVSRDVEHVSTNASPSLTPTVGRTQQQNRQSILGS